MTLLTARPGWPFQELKSELQMSDGNLVTHLRTLQRAGYVKTKRETLGRPQTTYFLTEKGRTAFRIYLEDLEKIVKLSRR